MNIIRITQWYLVAALVVFGATVWMEPVERRTSGDGSTEWGGSAHTRTGA